MIVSKLGPILSAPGWAQHCRDPAMGSAELRQRLDEERRMLRLPVFLGMTFHEKYRYRQSRHQHTVSAASRGLGEESSFLFPHHHPGKP